MCDLIKRYMWSYREHSSFVHCIKKHDEEGEEARSKQELKEKEELNKKKKGKASLKKVQKKCSKLDTKENELDSYVSKTNEQINIAKQMLEDANNSLDQAISESNTTKIKIARRMIAAANEKTSTISSHLKEQAKVRNKIGQKRKAVRSHSKMTSPG